VECSNFLERIEFDQTRAVTTNFVVDEVCYSLIITKGSQLLQTTRIKTIQDNLKKNKELSEICYLEAELFLDYLEVLKNGGFSVIDVKNEDMKNSLKVGKGNLLLPRDAIYLYICKRCGIVALASNDEDFEKIDSLRIWKAVGKS